MRATLPLLVLLACDDTLDRTGDTGLVIVETGETALVIDTADTALLDTSDTALVPRCADRTGGALVTFDVVGETFTGWFTDDAFVDAARAHLDAGTSQVPVFGQVLRGTDCDEQWRFHVDPADVSFADLTIELCDGTPSYVDGHLDAWIDQVGSWCPWSAVVTAVDDRR